jgi:hypothetical protein
MSIPGGQEQTLFRYSITWSAYDSSDGGMVRSSALPDLRWMTNSDLTGTLHWKFTWPRALASPPRGRKRGREVSPRASHC